MLHKYKMQPRSMKALILDAWEQDKEKLLRNLGGIDKGLRNEERIRQIEQTIASLQQAQQDDGVRIGD